MINPPPRIVASLCGHYGQRQCLGMLAARTNKYILNPLAWPIGRWSFELGWLDQLVYPQCYLDNCANDIDQPFASGASYCFCQDKYLIQGWSWYRAMTQIKCGRLGAEGCHIEHYFTEHWWQLSVSLKPQCTTDTTQTNGTEWYAPPVSQSDRWHSWVQSQLSRGPVKARQWEQLEGRRVPSGSWAQNMLNVRQQRHQWLNGPRYKSRTGTCINNKAGGKFINKCGVTVDVSNKGAGNQVSGAQVCFTSCFACVLLRNSTLKLTSPFLGRGTYKTAQISE